MEAQITTIYLSSHYDCTGTIALPDGGTLEVRLTGESLKNMPIDDRYAKIRERCNRHMESAMEDCQFVNVHYRGRDYLCRKVYYREQTIPNTPFTQTLIMSAHLCKILLHDTQCDAPEIVAEAEAVDSRCAFSLDDISGDNDQFIARLHEKYTDMDFVISVQKE